MFTKKWLSTLFLCFCFILSKGEYTALSFYVVAHQDDWQLFMGSHAYKNLQNPKSKNIFIYTTAGDAGLIGDQGNGEGYGSCNNCTMPYFRARELGALSSIQTVNPPSSVSEWCAAWPYPEMTEEVFTFNTKKWYVKKYIYCNSISYFLRIKDGALLNLKNGDSVVTITENKTDHRNVFKSWSDLTTLLNKIITHEKGDLSSFWINTHEADESINHFDHRDHIYTSLACQDATKGLDVTFNYFIGYYSEELKPNLSAEQAIQEAALMVAYNKSKLDAGWWSDWEKSQQLCLRSYHRVVKSSFGISHAIRLMKDNWYYVLTAFLVALPIGYFRKRRSAVK